MSSTGGSSVSHEISHLAVLEAEMETTWLLSETGHSYKHWNKFNNKNLSEYQQTPKQGVNKREHGHDGEHTGSCKIFQTLTIPHNVFN